VLLKEIENWIAKNNSKLDRDDVRVYLRQWERAQEKDSYFLKAPGRIAGSGLSSFASV